MMILTGVYRACIYCVVTSEKLPTKEWDQKHAQLCPSLSWMIEQLVNRPGRGGSLPKLTVFR